MKAYIHENIHTGKLNHLIPEGVTKHLPGGKESFNIVVRDSADLPEGERDSLAGDRFGEKQDIVPKVFTVKNKDLYNFRALPQLAQSADFQGKEDEAQENEKTDFGDLESILNTHRVPVAKDQRVPPLTDRMNTNLKNIDSSRISQNL